MSCRHLCLISANSLFLQGGSGITYILPRLRDLLLYVRLTSPLSICSRLVFGSHASKNNACVRRVVFVWTVRHHCTSALCRFSLSDSLTICPAAHIGWLDSELKKALATASSISDLSVSATIYVTSNSGSGLSSLDDGTSSVSSSSPQVRDLEKEGSYDDQISPSSEKMSADAFPSVSGVEVKFGRLDVAKTLEEAVTSSDGPVSVDGQLHVITYRYQCIYHPFPCSLGSFFSHCRRAQDLVVFLRFADERTQGSA